ncbi:hypothetical protein GX51_04700 [Blastomyces parvus]|uniref:Uncharacterized protein n=1 Tax=Blastomyces parvus TaxID=2060905 RepID=A0A2B7X0Z7_9EURO|nr:hypothetical protein GX51_04700 [Blastomyces parvus]
MLDSPAKRRKSNSSSAIAVSASNTAQQSQPNGIDIQKPQRPSRASFQSPTRASLARSHPDVLTRVLSRSPAKTAQQKPASRGRESAGIGGVEDRRPGIRGSRLPRPSSLSATSALVTELPIRQVIQKRTDPLSPGRGSSVPVSASQPPQKSLQQSRVSLSAEPGAELSAPRPPSQGKDPTPGPIEDESIPNGRRTRSLSSPDQGAGEPELPPTPTELGLESVPSRSRRLLSSSSPSSRQEKKKRRIRDGVKNPSPLKPKDTDVFANNGADQVASPRIYFPEQDIPDPVEEKIKLRDALVAQLARLKEEIGKIEYETQRYEKPDEYPAPDEESINNLIELLTTSNPSCAPPPPPPPSPPPVSSLLSFLLPFSSSQFIPSAEPTPPPSTSPPPENPFALQQPADLTPYLTLFAPLSLTAHTTTATSTSILPTSTQELSSSSPTITQTHNLALSAPAPFPSHLFQIPIILQTNPESQSVVSISIPPQPLPHDPDKGTNHNIPTTLFSWLQTRLSNPLLQRDISGLCWGISRYWEADISRAKIWAQLEELRDQIITGTISSAQKNNDKDKKTYTPHNLLPHLGRTSFLFSVETRQQAQQRKQKAEVAGSVHPSSPQLLVTCPLTLDIWTSEPLLQPDISVSVPQLSAAGSSEKVEREAKRVFLCILKSGHGKGKGWRAGGHGQVEIDGDADVLVRAVEGVVGVLFGVV